MKSKRPINVKVGDIKLSATQKKVYIEFLQLKKSTRQIAAKFGNSQTSVISLSNKILRDAVSKGVIDAEALLKNY